MATSSTSAELPATNTKTFTATTAEEIRNYNNYFKSVGIHFQKTASCFVDVSSFKYNMNKGDFSDRHTDNINDSDSVSKSDELDDGALTTPEDRHACDPKANNNYETSGNNNKDFEQNVASKTVRRTPNTLDLYLTNDASSPTSVTNASKKRKLLNTRYNFNQMLNEKFYNQFQLNEIVEECGYDSDIGKFNCKPSNESSVASDSGSSIELPIDKETFSDQTVINNLNTPNKQTADFPKKDYREKFNIQVDTGFSKIVIDKEGGLSDTFDGAKQMESINDTKNDYSSILCLTAFFTSAIWLYFYPLPN